MNLRESGKPLECKSSHLIVGIWQIEVSEFFLIFFFKDQVLWGFVEVHLGYELP